MHVNNFRISLKDLKNPDCNSKNSLRHFKKIPKIYKKKGCISIPLSDWKGTSKDFALKPKTSFPYILTVPWIPKDRKRITEKYP